MSEEPQASYGETPVPLRAKRVRRLLIASPSRGHLPHAYLVLWDKIRSKGIPGWQLDLSVEASQVAINVSRNILAYDAVHGGFDRMLMLDLDHPVDIPHITRILSHDHDAVPIVSGLYSIKKPGEPWFLGIKKKGAQPNEQHLLEAEFLPTGFLSVSTDALRKIAAAHPDREFYVQDEAAFAHHGAITPVPRRTKATMTEFFPIGVNGPRTDSARLRRIRRLMMPVIERGVGSTPRPRMLEAMHGIVAALTDEQEPGYLTGEDYFFSWLANLAGIPQYLDLACMVPHRGSIDYPIVSPDVVAKTFPQIPGHESDISGW